MQRIMIVDDDVTIQMELEEYLNHLNHDVVGIADTGDMAVHMARDLKPDLIYLLLFLAAFKRIEITCQWYVRLWRNSGIMQVILDDLKSPFIQKK